MLSDRQRLILHAIVDNYIHNAEPVGSRTISKRADIGYSSATIRNDMADLEELGYLKQPHTSAGRVPSTKGYRFYVDNLVKPKNLPEADAAKLKQLFADRMTKTEQVIEHTAAILSQMTNYTAVVLGPEIYEHRLKQIQIVLLNERQAVAIIVTNTGRVENKLVELPPGIPPTDIEKVVNILNENLVDVPLHNLRQRLYSELAELLRQHVEHYEEMVKLIEHLMTTDKDERIVLRGATKIMEQPEFRDVEKIRDLFELLEQSDQLIQLFGPNGDGMTIKIGQENDVEAIKDCTIISTAYFVDGKPVGTVGILGPTRMEYARVIGVLNYLAVGLSRQLSSEFERR